MSGFHRSASATTPVASLVVPSYAGAQRLGRLAEALRKQRFAGGWEAVVVVDGVVDETEAVLAAYDDLPLRVVVFGENRGRPAALNAGFAAAEGRVLIRCDDDLEPDPWYVANHVLAHEGVAPVGVVGLYRNRFAATAYARAYGMRYDRSVRAGAYGGSLADSRYFWAGNCSVTRATYDLVGDYDEDFRSYGWEDIDWGFRLEAAGVPIVLDPRLETVHHAANADAVTRFGRAYASGVARVRFDAKHGTRFAQRPGGGLKGRAWRSLVDVCADHADPTSFDRVGSAVDRLLKVCPPSVGFRLVALGADVAVSAGYRHGLDASSDAPSDGAEPR